ncbi:universal stress protein [Natronolimnohabitans innermongolicus]|uniref:UspA domain-containing protein n=1 Tax=Natronolimnohabitans innermongolicus JCM 12255 TaxID=1227499 RepID=L9XBA0_9EURY|nr:universal stress protein [Natronolimnohabitans innermongolicus]ELY58716.1 UspA domain-containing protein [Natronolimnohabitans innermongolicus JCM 12255]
MSEHILVPYDGSEPAEAALEYAFETFPDADVTALYVIPIPEGYWAAFEDTEDRIPSGARDHGDTILDDAVAVAADHDRDIDAETATGRPDHEIVDWAEDGEYDTVVIGSHGREGVSRILLGSVAENVVRRAPIPVIVVR